MKASDSEKFVAASAVASAVFGGAVAYLADRRLKSPVKIVTEERKNVGF